MMMEREKLVDDATTFSSFKLLFVILIKLEIVAATRGRNSNGNTSNHSCYTCTEPLIGYTDHPDSCRNLNVSSPVATTFIQGCDGIDDNGNGYECRKLVVSYRSIDTYMRRDCAPKGQCSWKDKTQSMINTPVSSCVYTNEQTQKLECIYCCDTPLCNGTVAYHATIHNIVWLFSLFLTWWRTKRR